MAKLMWIAAIVLVAVGLALGLMIFFSPTSIVSWGITPEVSALLLVGGILSAGLGGIIDALETVPPAPAVVTTNFAPEAPAEAAAPIPEFGRRASEAAAPVAAAVAADLMSSDVKETIDALEQAKQDLKQALGEQPEAEAVETGAEAEVMESADAAEPVIETVIEEETAEAVATAEEEEAVDDGQLYVVEERTIRDRPARILSDGTVEAETDEGWMRFENLEHLDEYLEAMSPASRS